MTGFAAFVIYLGRRAQKNARAFSKAFDNEQPDSMVRLRHAKTSAVKSGYDPSDEPSGVIPEPLNFGDDELSESEITPIEEFLDKATTAERRRELAAELRECGCRLSEKDSFKPKVNPEGGKGIIPGQKPSGGFARSSMTPEDGTDEMLEGPDSY